MTQPDASPPVPDTTEPPRGGNAEETPSLREVVRTIGWELGHPETGAIPSGDVAALRRARPGEIGGPAFWKIAVRHLEPANLLPAASAPWRDAAERRWTAILQGMAEMAKLHGGGLRVGRALAERSVSEHRLLRLLRAEGEGLLDQVRTISHLLANRGARIDWTDLAELVYYDGRPPQHSVRRRIALDYYSHKNR